ncbi:MAG: proton-conducting transporter membrane subunit [Bacillota bacterium]|nr:proton-conducting transporter membrane subunit [Bacillota bacterium]
MNFEIFLPIIIPIIMGLVVGISKPSSENINKIVIITTIVNFFLVLYIVLFKNNIFYHMVKINEFLDLYLHPDSTGKIFAILVSSLWIFTTFYSIDYMGKSNNLNKFFMFFLITEGVTLGIAFSGNLITLYLFYELLTLSTFPLVIEKGSEKALNAGKKYLIYSFFGATMVLFGIILLYSQTQNLSFIPGGVVGSLVFGNKNLYFMIYILLFLGFGVKAALVPFHSWLPSAMVAPTPVSALLHAVAVVKSGIFALGRMTYYVLGWRVIEFTEGNKYTLILVLLTILMGSFLAIHQENLKRRLAYSTISQLGYIMLALVIFENSSYIGGMLHMLFHATVKITLFFCVGAIMHYEKKTELHEIAGIGKKMPKTMISFTVASICLIGIPPTNGFVSKWFLAIGGLDQGNYLIPIILLLSAFFTAAYLIPIISTAFFKGNPSEEVEVSEPNNFMLIPIIILAAINVILGIFPNAIINTIQIAAEKLF